MIVTIADRPDLVAIVADWLWHAFWRDDGYTLEQTTAVVAASTARSGPPQTFVLLEDAIPVATASFTAVDLDERPDLTPWLAGVFVALDARRRGHASALIAAVEAAGRRAGFPRIWLYTDTAARSYERLGWKPVETILRPGRRPVTLMQRSLME